MPVEQITITDVIATSSIKGLRVNQPVKEALCILGPPDAPPGRIAKNIWLYTFGNVSLMFDDRELVIQISINFEQPYKRMLVLLGEVKGWGLNMWQTAGGKSNKTKKVVDIWWVTSTFWRANISADGQLDIFTLFDG